MNFVVVLNLNEYFVVVHLSGPWKMEQTNSMIKKSLFTNGFLTSRSFYVVILISFYGSKEE